MKIAIIGAGFAACNLYNLLKKNHDITIFEKSRGTGGRISTKYFDNKYVDHGTPFIETNNNEFISFLNELCKKKVLKLEENRYLPLNGINKICSSLIEKKDLFNKCKIEKIYKQNNKWHLQNDKKDIYLNFDFLIFTMPTPQILEFNNLLNSEIQNKLEKIEYKSMATILFTSKNNKKLDIEKLESLKIFEKVINNSEKYNYDEFSSFVLHISEDFLNKYSHLKRLELFEEVYKRIDETLEIKVKEIFQIHEHFWRYAFAKNYLNEPFLIDEENSIGVCGDYFQILNLEASFHSSSNLANRILSIKKNINQGEKLC